VGPDGPPGAVAGHRVKTPWKKIGNFPSFHCNKYAQNGGKAKIRKKINNYETLTSGKELWGPIFYYVFVAFAGPNSP
jgi:hypothetical protein